MILKDNYQNRLLLTLLNVNRLIVKEKDSDALIQKICEILIETLDFNFVWIALKNNKGKFINTAEAGLGEDFLPIKEKFKKGEIIQCAQKALNEKRLVVTENDDIECSNCPILKKCNSYRKFTIPLISGDDILGLLYATVPTELILQKNEIDFFEELAGDIAFALCLINKEEKRKLAEETLKREKFLLCTLINNIPEKIYFKNGKSEFTQVNRSMADLVGLKDPEEAIGKTDFDFFTIEHAKKAFNDEQKLLKTEKPLIEVEEKETWPDGRITWALTTKLPLKNENNKIIGTFGISRDITERKKAEAEIIKARKQAEEANRSKSEFLANMSHEIRTPMNSILGFSEIMLNTIENEKHRGYLKTILGSGKTLLSLINDILDLSKIEAGKLEISPEPVDMRAVLNEIEQIFDQKIREKNIDYITDIDEQFPLNITIDEVRIRQILLNLVGNAVKFTSTGFIKTELNVINDNNGVIDIELSIIDTGIGIASDDKMKIFESFSQQSGQTVKHFGGTGLGLAICKRLCELMNGRIEVESKIGKGSKFTIKLFDLKYSEEAVSQNNLYLWDEKNINFKSAKILVIDDIPFNRDLVSSYLENHNLTILEAENGLEGIATATHLKPELIFMDIRMPGMDGYEATRIIKKQKETSSIPIIALTASTMQSEGEKIKELFDGYLRKPVNKKTLINELIQFLPYENIDDEISTGESSNIAKEELPEEIDTTIKKSFREKFFERMDELEGIMIMNELEDFANSLSDFANEHKIMFLNVRSEKLKIYISEFDFGNITICFNELKSFFK